MKDEELRKILEKHRKWLNNEDGGERANLQRANLQWVNLRVANLQWADLRRVNLQGTNLHGVNLQGADLRVADLRVADLQRANLDYSCWPLWCGSLGVIVDKRIAAQLAYHFCRLICDDPDVKAAQQAIKGLANQFHRVNECGVIK